MTALERVRLAKLTAKIALLLPLKALALLCDSGFRKRLLVAAKPSLPACILRHDAAPSHLSCRLAEIKLIVQDRFCIAQLVDVQNRPALSEQLAKPDE
jgi:hypothetical protein